MTTAAKLIRKHLGHWLRLWTPPILISWYKKTRITDLALSPPNVLKQMSYNHEPLKLNLCCGPLKLLDYVNIDIDPSADVVLNLEQNLLPFPDTSAEVVVCMSAINYFTRERALEIICDVHRVLQPDGVVRFGVQDLRVLADKYLQRDEAFFFQRTANKLIRFPGETFADKFNHWFYGFGNGLGNFSKYVYDFETLSLLFERAGFIEIEQKSYQDSVIPNIDQIDNRPEQMFFLEAHRPSVHHFLNKGIQLTRSGHREEGWQHVLRALELDISDKPSLHSAFEIIRQGKRSDDALKLLDSYNQCFPEDTKMESIRVDVVAQINRQALDPEEATARSKVLDDFNGRRNSVLPDDLHLHECMNWLRHAQSESVDAGVPTLYDMVKRQWDVSYPETTGYIIPTFLAYARWSGKPEFHQIAMEMGDWEIRIQALNGGVGEPVGSYNQPRIFNTGQVLFGWLALFRETGEFRYLQAAEKAAHFIMHHLDDEGRWVKYTFLNAPRSYKVRVAWALLELYAVTRHKSYLMAARRAVRWVLTQACDNGWFHANSLSRDNRVAITHTIGYTLVGLLEIYRLHNASCDYRRILEVLREAGDNLAWIYLRRRESTAKPHFRGYPARFDARWHSSDQWSCVTGNTQIEFFLRRLMRYVDNPDYLSVADMLLDEMKTLHFVDGINDENLRGGLYGSDPINGAYCPYIMPNWGVKFFADSLLQRIISPDEQFYVG